MTFRYLLLGGMGCLLAACSPTVPSGNTASDTASEQLKTLTIYSARHYDSDALMYEAFDADTGIQVNLREAGAPQLLETLKAEGDASPADLIIAADAGSLWRFQQAGLTQAVTSKTLNAEIPEKFRDAGGHWYGVSKRLRGVVYDTGRWTAEDVSDWNQLAAPGMQGEICVRASSNIYNLSLMSEMIARIGEDAAAAWASAIVGNMARQPQGGDTDQIRAIAAGECSVAIANHYYLARLRVSPSDADQAAAASVAFAVPDFGDQGGAHVNVTGVAVTANSQNVDAATAFITYLMGSEGQTYLTMETRELPMLEGMPPPQGADILPDYTASEISLSLFGENQATAQRLYDLAGWN